MRKLNRIRLATLTTLFVASSFGAEPKKSHNPVSRQEIGVWKVKYHLFPHVDAFFFKPETYEGTETVTLSSDGSVLHRSHDCPKLRRKLSDDQVGFAWLTGDDISLNFDSKTTKYIGRWSKTVEAAIGKMEGTYDEKTKALSMKYLDPKMPQRSDIVHITEYIDKDTKKVTITAPENTIGPKASVILEMIAKRKAE